MVKVVWILLEVLKGSGASKNDIRGYFLLDYVKKAVVLNKKTDHPL
ncbi:MAG: hypothetical protein HY026_07475 [Deltaproteobacteria bacterium]|nr:hypothetical protein [Deltaproteobacteria bacterium]